ncbi:MAG: hypothetical protein JNM78_09625 [Cyclobacteriaceae bacterium]|nr:hypothetical protein [Cyclobacteriaceae bacterium]
MERQKFDDAWQNALSGAEQSPSENVWTAIDNKLTAAEGGTMKRRVIFYQRLAAASILFAVVLGSLTAYYINENSQSNNRLADGKLNHEQSENQFSENNSGNNPVVSNALTDNDQLADDRLANDKVVEKPLASNQLNEAPLVKDIKGVRNNSSRSNKQADVSTQEVTRPMNQMQPVLLADNKERASAETNVVSNKVRPRHQNFATLSIKDLPSPEANVSNNVKEVTIIRKLPAMPASMMADSRKDKVYNENFWASVGASTGNYSPQVTSTPSALTATPAFGNFLRSQSTANHANSKGTAYSVGLHVATRISDRWLLLGGVNYLNQTIGYTSNLASISANNTPSVYAADYANKQSNSNIALTSPYEINSVNELVSVPVQAGYLIINRKVGVQVNSGVATNFFLQNTLTDRSGQLSEYSEGAGDSSPYKGLNWSAIMGSEISYKIGDQYRISFVPGLRYPLSAELKSPSSSYSSIVWDVGFRFRYIFK